MPVVKKKTKKKTIHTVLEEMVLFRTRIGSIPRFIYGTPKWFYWPSMEPQGSI